MDHGAYFFGSDLASQKFIGFLFVAMPILCLPTFCRIIFVFQTNREYNHQEFYRILSHLGVAVFVMAPGIMMNGIKLLLDEDVYQLCISALKVTYASAVAKYMFMLALAFNRLKIVVGCNVPKFVSKGLVMFGYFLFLFLTFFQLITPRTWGFVHKQLLPRLNYSSANSHIVKWTGFMFVSVPSGIIILIYLTIFLLLLYRSTHSQYVVIRGREKILLILAVLLFALDISGYAIFYLWRDLISRNKWYECAFVVLESLDIFAFPQVLYLCMIRTLPPDCMIKVKRDDRRRESGENVALTRLRSRMTSDGAQKPIIG
uniref:Serpentine receptor class gamma n=1 Tax=Steinernema glaseri TaxID=37863 RepID=A0A1I7YMQ5_9BILA